MQDIRKALDDKDLDAISIATPNHWHSLMTIWACQAGKDVYVEKPLSHNVVEGRRCVEAARKYNRIVQHGTQQRSSASRANEIAAVQSGKYGKLLVSKGYCCKPRWSIGHKDTTHAAGRPRLQPLAWAGGRAAVSTATWSITTGTGSGISATATSATRASTRWTSPAGPSRARRCRPRSGASAAGFAYEDQGQTPNMQMAVMEYGDVLLVFEVRGLVDKPKESPFKFKVANEYYTTEGRIADGQFYPEGRRQAARSWPRSTSRSRRGGAWGSFLHAVRSRKVEDCNADVEHRPLLVRLSTRPTSPTASARRVPFDGKAKLGDNREVVETFKNLQENLTGSRRQARRTRRTSSAAR